MKEQHEPEAHSPLKERSAGVLLHPTSLPGPWETGDLGAEAYRFVDFLAASGQRVWQILPLGPTHGDRSPYQSLSVHAGNPDLISIENLVELGWLEAGQVVRGPKGPLIAAAYEAFLARADGPARAEFDHFVESNHAWLEDYALFQVLKATHQDRGWTDWPPELRDRKPEALEAVRLREAQRLGQMRFEQFVFARQWKALRAYANAKRIGIFGDMPIFVAHDSADVWAQRECFLLDSSGHPIVVAGVPPDYFSATGQRWGNPHYDWDYMESNSFSWWQARVESALKLYDLVRIDHFRGFQAYWEVPAYEETAISGRWVEAPGDELFRHLHEHIDPLPIVAEDLGIITPEVEALRCKWALPGMKVLQFAFDGGAGNPYLPHNHELNYVVYTGTHDNDTTLGWFNTLPEATAETMMSYLGHPSEPMPWPLMRAAYASVAKLAIVPMQDALALGTEHRMNIPGTVEGNWRWRFTWEAVPEGLTAKLRDMMALYGRIPN